MTISRIPRVRDMTQRTRHVRVTTDGGSIHDMLLVLWLAFDPNEDHEGFDMGHEWFQQVADSTPADLRAEIEQLGGVECGAWCAVRGIVARAPGEHDVDSVLTWLETVDPAEIRRGLFGYMCESPAQAHLAEKAATGDQEAFEELFGEKPEVRPYYEWLVEVDQSQLRTRLVDTLRRFRDEVYSVLEKEFSGPTTHAASAVAALAKGADPERVIERVTNGLDYRIPAEVNEIVLIPSVVVRPWAVIDRFEDLLTVVFPVEEEYLNADPDAPPPWVVRIYKALGDEKRLRIMKRLAAGPATLDELSDLLDLTKSTVHHHVGLLRGAGLARVVIDPATGNKTYSLRPTVLPGAHEGLEKYLGIIPTEPHEAS